MQPPADPTGLIQPSPEDSLRESERRYRTLIEALPQLVWTCLPDGNCDYLSKQWVEYTGIPEAEQLGLAWLDRVMHPDDRQRTAEAWLRAVADHAPYDLQYRLRRHDGVYRCFQTRGRPIRDAEGKIVQWFGTCTDIDDQVRAQEETVRAAEELERQWRVFDTALSNVPDYAYLFDLQGKFTYANRALAALLQKPLTGIVGKNFAELDYPAGLAARLQREIQEVIESRKGLRAETLFAAPSAPDRLYEYIFVPVVGKDGRVEGVAGSTRDITDRKEAEQRLRDSEERVRFALQSGRMSNWDYDLSVDRIGRSPEYDRIFGHEQPLEDRGYAAMLARFVPEDREHVHRNFQQAIEDSGELEFEARIKDQDGDLRWIWMRGRHYRESADSRSRILVGLVSDVTERKRMEERLREAAKLESIGLLAGGIAHDFNNLLTGILGNTSLALSQMDQDQEVYPLLDQVLLAGERAADLTKQMLAYSGRGRFELGRVDLSAAIREINTLIRASIAPSVAVTLNLANDLPPVEADPAQIQQVIMNLILNEAEAIEGRQGTVTVSTYQCHLNEAEIASFRMPFSIEVGDFICLTVKDDGCGMDEARQKKIFDPFFTTKSTGRGLGLSAVLGILRGHKGAMKVVSELGAGTEFTVFFRAAEGAAPGKEESLIAPVRGRGTFLVVDDEGLVRKAASRILEDLGFHVLCAGNGQEAVDVFRNASGPIGAVLLDLSMPVLDGESALPLLLELQPETRVILSSGYGETEALLKFSGRGLAGFLQKPYTAARLRALLVDLGIGQS